MTSIEPYIIITAGLTGSGKSNIHELIQQKYKLNQNIVKIMIDNLIEPNPSYKTLIDTIIKNYCNSKFELCEQLQKLITNPTPEILLKFNEAYFAIRKGTYCTNEGIPIVCNDLNDLMLTTAINNKQNIVLETTGENNIDWLFPMLDKSSKKYNIYHVFIRINLEQFLKRNTGRAFIQFNNYISNTANNAPRLPNISKEVYNEKIKKIEENYEKYKSLYKDKLNIKLLTLDGNLSIDKINEYTIQEIPKTGGGIKLPKKTKKKSKSIKKKKSKKHTNKIRK
jgi:hypothetical protein